MKAWLPRPSAARSPSASARCCTSSQASSSTLTISHVTPDFDPEVIKGVARSHEAAGSPGQARSQKECTRVFDGWELLEPGVTVTHRWRPDIDGGLAQVTDVEAACYRV